MHQQSAIEGLDDGDVEHGAGVLPQSANIVSEVYDPELGRSIELQTDARSLDSNTDVLLQQSVSPPSGEAITFPSETANSLRFSLRHAHNDFGSKPITIQQYDPCDGSVQYPVYDVRTVMRVNEGIVPLASLRGSYDSGVPYAYLRLSFTRESSRDLHDNGRLDLREFAVLGQDWSKGTVISLADLAGPRGVGLPDGRIVKLCLGVGDRNDPQLGGEGTLYFDDIALLHAELDTPSHGTGQMQESLIAP